MKPSILPQKEMKSFLAFFIVFLLTVNIHAQIDTLQPSDIIKPYNIPDSLTVFSSFHHAIPIGDINGDGLTDFGFPSYSSTQYNGTYLVTDIHHPLQATFLPVHDITGIGDYNGDGFDDFLSEENWLVYLGNASGKNFDTVAVPVADINNSSLKFHGDINGDGKSDLLYQAYTNYSEKLYIMSYDSAAPKNINFTIWTPEYYNLMCHVYDYDNDGTNELLIISLDFGNQQNFIRYKYGWFVYDSETDMYVPESIQYRYFIHEPQVSFTSALSDINGDGLMDICHDFYLPDSGFQMEVYFGSTEAPFYFDNATIISVNNNNRLLYSAGDINEDGADDWYSKYYTDSIVVYYGSPDIAEQGAFTKEFYPLIGNRFFTPFSKYGDYKLATQPEILDYDNDGINDLFFEYWSFDENGRYDTSGTAIVKGGEHLDFDHPDLIGTKAAESFYSGFGNVLKNAGDFNKDGYDDWAVLSPRGIMNLYFGGKTLDFDPDLTIMLPQYLYVSSYDMAFGDLNGDGWIDIAISNSSSSDINWSGGLFAAVQNIYIFSGGQIQKDTLYADDAMKVWEYYDTINQSYNPLGQSLNIIGDYNADGFNDLVSKSSKSRKALVYYGREELADEADELITVYCNNFSSQFAVPVTACGDINGDGYDDFTLGDSSNGKGQSLVYLGGPDADNQYDFVLENTDPDGHGFGAITPKVSGDFNDDGYCDIAQWNNNNDSLLIYLGGDEFDNIPDIILTDSILRNFGYIEYVNNFSKKGRADILITSYPNSTMYLFYGTNENKQRIDLVLNNSLHTPPTSLASGDFNNDGYTDVFTGHPHAIIDGKVAGGLVQHYVSQILTSVKEKKKMPEEKLMLKPNPASTFVQATLNTPGNDAVFIRVTDINGRTLISKKGSGNHFETLNISSFPAGIYFVTITSGTTSVTGKLIKH